jgi:predicted phosphoribosyltransferase
MLGRHDAIEDIEVQADDRRLRGTLGVPQGPVGLVVLAGVRDHVLAEAFRARGLATLELEIAAVGDLGELADDLIAFTAHVLDTTKVSHLPIGYLGADCYAAAAVVAAARRPDLVRALVAFGGRIDVAGVVLTSVRAPTLLITDRDDDDLIERDRDAIEMMTALTQLAIVPGAFRDPDMRDTVVELAADWLLDHFSHALQEPASRRGTWGRQFRDRRSAGERLADLLAHCTRPGCVVLGLPPGGVVVADEVSRRLGAPLDIWLCRKIGMPIQPELGMGALAEGASLLLDPTMVRWSGATDADIRALVHAKSIEIRARSALYRGDMPAVDVRGKTAVLVDDGITTAGTLRAAVHGVRRRGAARVIVAAPVASADAVELLKAEADEIVCVATPRNLMSIGSWYQDFRPVSDLDVVAILAAARTRTPVAA